jgi:multicomponent Na+:H+ antiporter subunit D
MLSKAVKNYTIKKIIIRSSLFLAFIISFCSSILLMVYSYHNGAIDIIVGGYQKGVGISYSFTFISFVINILAILITFISYLYDARDAIKKPVFIVIFLIQLSSIMMAISTRDLFNLFVALEVMGITSYVLIAFGRNVRASLASLSYLLVSSATMIFFLIGTYGLYRISGSLDYEMIKLSLYNSDPSWYVWLSATCIIVPIILRSAIIGLHFWLPPAHAMAMHPVSAMLSGLIIKIPIITLTFLLPIFPFSKTIGSFLAIAGLITASVGGIYAYCQSDVKKLLAYSSVSQMGYIIASFGASFSFGLDTPAGQLLYIASLSHIIFHSMFKSTLFLSIGTTVDILKNRNVYEMRDGAKHLMNQSKSYIIIIISFFIAMCSIIALPPFNGFYSKYLISSYMYGDIATILLFITSSFTIASFIKLSRIFLPQKGLETLCVEKKELTLKGRLSTGLLTALLIASAALAPQMMIFFISLVNVNGNTHFYSIDSVLKTVGTFTLGILLYVLIRFYFIKRLMINIDSRYISLQTILVYIPVSIALFTIYLFYAT